MPYGTVNADVIGTSVANTSLGAGNASIMKNRIINGAMVISQRNGTSSITPASGGFLTDRFGYYASQASKVTAQQLSASPPVGFSNYLGITVATAVSSLGSTDFFYYQQKIEGFNTADLRWGTSNAKTITVSFWVQSSLTGTFGGSLRNGNENRGYPFSYTISAANTWEYKTITIAGDTTGTWNTDNTTGIGLCFSLGMGSTYSNTAGAWATGNYASATGVVNVMATLGATFNVTGVQLEVGSSATGFEYRQYGQELALCQRYFQIFKTTGGQYDYLASGAFYNSTQGRFFKPLLVTMRTSPSLTVVGTTYVDSVSYVSLTSLSLESAEPESFRMGFTASSAGSNATGYGCFLASSTSSTESLSLSAEL